MASKILSRFQTHINITSTRLSSGAAHAGGKKKWRNYTYFVTFPAILALAVNWQLLEKEHHAHWKRPEFVPYEHLRIRTKAFPWGDGNHSLFHNKDCALPEGYEDEQ